MSQDLLKMNTGGIFEKKRNEETEQRATINLEQ